MPAWPVTSLKISSRFGDASERYDDDCKQINAIPRKHEQRHSSLENPNSIGLSLEAGAVLQLLRRPSAADRGPSHAQLFLTSPGDGTSWTKQNELPPGSSRAFRLLRDGARLPPHGPFSRRDFRADNAPQATSDRESVPIGATLQRALLRLRRRFRLPSTISRHIGSGGYHSWEIVESRLR